MVVMAAAVAAVVVAVMEGWRRQPQGRGASERQLREGVVWCGMVWCAVVQSLNLSAALV